MTGEDDDVRLVDPDVIAVEIFGRWHVIDNAVFQNTFADISDEMRERGFTGRDLDIEIVRRLQHVLAVMLGVPIYH